MRRARTPRHFPRMKIRGARRRGTAWLHGFQRSMDELARAAGIGAAAFDMFAHTVAAFDSAPDYDDSYLERLGREAPPDDVECPTWFTWSAFGATYPDTECTGGRLTDLDSGTYTYDPCPMHRAADFYEQHFGGGYIIPTCARCERQLPTETPLQWHERGRSLSASAVCPSCERRTWTLMRDYADAVLDGNEDVFPLWRPADDEAVSRG